MLAGGADIDPATYGAEPHPETTSTWPERDALRARARAAARSSASMPVLGICRGMQLLNVALGGTLDPAPARRNRPQRPHAHARAHSATTRSRSSRARSQLAPPAPSGSPSSPTTTRGSSGSATGWSRAAGQSPTTTSSRRSSFRRRSGYRARRDLAPGGGRPERDHQLAGRGRRTEPRVTGGGVIEVVEPATEQVMAELRARAPRRSTPRWQRRRPRFPLGAPSAPAERAATAAASSPTRSRRGPSELATLEARNAGKPISDARGEIAMVIECFRYYAGAPERLLGQTIPVDGRRRHDLPRAARCRRADHSLELPAGDRVVEGGAGARRRQHRGAEAGRADAAHIGRAREDRARSRARPRAC